MNRGVWPALCLVIIAALVSIAAGVLLHVAAAAVAAEPAPPACLLEGLCSRPQAPTGAAPANAAAAGARRA